MSTHESMSLKDATQQMQAVQGNLQAGLHGLSEPAALMVDAFFSAQHILLDGDPGIGKTALAENLAASLKVDGDNPATYAYILGVGDRMPSDILGTEIYSPKDETFRVRRGPIFRNVVVVDEVNRLPGKTQAALHEAMNSGTVSIGEESLKLPKPFIVVGTENAHGHGQGTNPTPNALADRFTVSYHYTNPSEEDRFVVMQADADKAENIKPKQIITIENTLAIIEAVSGIKVEEEALRFAARALTALSSKPGIYVKANGYRTAVSAERIAKARAVRKGEGIVSVDTMRSILPNVMRGRFDTDAQDPEGAKQQVIHQVLSGR